MAAPDTKNESQAAARRAEILKLHSRGWTKVAIAAELGVDEKTVRYYLKQIHAEAAKQTTDLAEAKRRELLMLDEAERAAWEAWDESRRDAETEVTRTLPDGGVQLERRREGRAGDSALLKRLIEISERRAKLLGLDAPTRTVGGVLTPEQLAGMSDDQLDDYIAKLSRAGAR